MPFNNNKANGFNFPIKRHRMEDCIKNTITYVLPASNTLHPQRHRLQMKGYKIIIQAAAAQKQTGILRSDKVDCKLILDKRDKGGHYIFLQGTIHQEEKTTANT